MLNTWNYLWDIVTNNTNDLKKINYDICETALRKRTATYQFS